MTIIEVLLVLMISSVLFSLSARSLMQSLSLNHFAQQQIFFDESAAIAKYFFEKDIRLAGYNFSLNQLTKIEGSTKLVSFSKACEKRDATFQKSIFPKIFGLNNSSDYFECVDRHVPESDILALRYLNPVENIDRSPRKSNALHMRLSLNEARLFQAKDESEYKNIIKDEYFENFEVKSFVYYLGYTNRHCGEDPITALYREYNDSRGFMRAEEIVSGVEQLQIRYLVNGHFHNASQILDLELWESVESVSISLLLRSDCESHVINNFPRHQLEDFPYIVSDQKNFQRQTYQFYISLRN